MSPTSGLHGHSQPCEAKSGLAGESGSSAKQQIRMSPTLWMTILAATTAIKTDIATEINGARHMGKLDVVEVCTPEHSGLTDAVRAAGLEGARLSNWNGFDLATTAGRNRTYDFLR